MVDLTVRLETKKKNEIVRLLSLLVQFNYGKITQVCQRYRQCLIYPFLNFSSKLKIN